MYAAPQHSMPSPHYAPHHRYSKRQQDYYEGLRDEYADLGSREKTAFMQKWDWRPPDDLLALLIADQNQRDRVELIVAFWAAGHGGNSPPFQAIADLMGICKGNAYRYALELTQANQGRAVMRAGQFWLTRAEYTHEVIKLHFSEMLRP